MAPAVAIDLLPLLALAFLIALSVAYRYSLGELLRQIAAAIGSIRLPGFLGGGRVLGFAADAITKADNAIRHAIGVAINAMQGVWNACLHYTAYAVEQFAAEVASLAHDVAASIETVTVTQVTNVYRKVNPALARRVGALAATVATLTHRLDHVVAQEAHVAKVKAQTVEHAIAVPGVDVIPKAIPGIKWLDDAARTTRAQLKSLAKYLTPAGIIGLVGATTFSSFGLGWLRCKGVGRVGRSLCGMSGLIEALYAGTLAAFAVTDLCRFAYGFEKVAESIRPVMLEWVDVETALLRCGSASYPRDFALPAYSPTPVVDAVAL